MITVSADTPDISTLALRTAKNNPKVIKLFSPAYPAGEVVATCELTWVAKLFCELFDAESVRQASREVAS